MVLKNGRLVDGRTGQPFTFEILANSNAQEALLLSYTRSLAPLGIDARVRVVDSAQYQERLSSYDYNMIQNTWPSSLSPGNEQLFRWSAKTADAQGSFNFAGVKNPAADAMINAMLAAETEENFISSVRALDRVLLSGDYVVPLLHAAPMGPLLGEAEASGKDAALRLCRRYLVGRKQVMPPNDLFNMADYAIGGHARATPDKMALLVCDVENPREPWSPGRSANSIARSAILRQVSRQKACSAAIGSAFASVIPRNPH